MRDEAQCHAVVAPALAGWARAIVEDVALVSTAAAAVVLHARVAKEVVYLRAHRAGQRIPETRPSRATVVLGLRREQRLEACGTDVRTRAILTVERARERGLGGLLEQDRKRKRREDRPPLVQRNTQRSNAARGGRRQRRAARRTSRKRQRGSKETVNEQPTIHESGGMETPARSSRRTDPTHQDCCGMGTHATKKAPDHDLAARRFVLRIRIAYAFPMISLSAKK